MNLSEMAKKRYEELSAKEKELKDQFEKQIEEVQKEKAGIKKYLESIGVLEVKKRGRRKKTDAKGTE
ncbi:MAG: hypothetical protein EHM20_06305 [Alphaproteobacteria bacterium]|nr:MAG: hypothetical protein EHM20_06305 [Alphaproteobacteria bacterium]